MWGDMAAHARACGEAANRYFEGRLDSAEAAVWLALADNAAPHNLAVVSQPELAARAGSSEPSVARAVKRLEAAGLVFRTAVPGVGTCYSLTAPEAAPVEVPHG